MRYQVNRRLARDKRRHWYRVRTRLVGMVGFAVLCGLLPPQHFHNMALQTTEAAAATLPTPSHSNTIALTSDDRQLAVVNREAHTLSIIRVRSPWGTDLETKITEIGVGLEPRCVVIHPNDREAYVTNGISGTVAVVNLRQLRVVATIPVGTEPRGCALTPNGALLYVANHTEGTVAIVNTSARQVVGKVSVGRNPTAIAITNNGNNNDLDETVFVTQIFAELIPGGPGEMRDLGKRGVVHAFPAGVVNPTITTITLSPLANSGFTANRTVPNDFCVGAHPAHAANPIFCPRPDLADNDPANTQNIQGVFPNQLLSALIRGNRLWLPNIGAQPEPPERFDVNVQALVHAVDTNARAEVLAEHINLNVQIATEPTPADPTSSLGKLFGNDIVSVDATANGSVFLFVSRGGNYVLRASLVNGQFNIGAPNNVVRFQTGNLPSGVVISQDGLRAYANNEANFSVTSMDLLTNTVLNRDIPSSEPPAPGSFEHSVLLGKVAFFTALGIPDNGIFDLPIRDLVPLTFRGKQSNSGWSSCGSCHPDGLADGVTWSFGTGPRQTKPLDGMFAKDNVTDLGILNWSAVRGSNHDFNANSRVTQGGCGFASVVATGGIDPPAQCTSTNPATLPQNTPANLAIYDHGITQGGSDALDVQTLWIFAAVRPLLQPQPTDTAALGRGRTVFAANCASCHGGAKWTKSEIFHRDNPAAVAQNGAPTDPGVTRLAPAPGAAPANEFFSFACGSNTFKYLDEVGTFNINEPIEIRDNGAASTAFGINGFNPPSLLSVNYHAPYLHRGQAQTLEEVFPLHGLGAGAAGFPPTTTIQTQLTAAQRADLLVFLKAIDGTTDQFRSNGDEFRDLCRICIPNPADPRCGKTF